MARLHTLTIAGVALAAAGVLDIPRAGAGPGAALRSTGDSSRVSLADRSEAATCVEQSLEGLRGLSSEVQPKGPLEPTCRVEAVRGRIIREAGGVERPAPQRRGYRVRSGDSWPAIARRHSVSDEALRAWNPHVERLHPKDELTLEVPVNFEPTPDAALGLDRDPRGLSLVPVPDGGESRGHPSRGRLFHGVQLPENPSLYTVRRPEFAFGSSHTVTFLQLSVAKFRARSDYTEPLVISDISQRRGGPFARHGSHQSGRDVDIWLPLLPGRAEKYKKQREANREDGEPGVGSKPLTYWDLGARTARDIDWPATLSLIRALVRTAEVRFIFLSRGRQRNLYRAARAEGMPKDVLSDLIEYPAGDRSAIVRHAPRHAKHMHVRFRCATDESRCY